VAAAAIVAGLIGAAMSSSADTSAQEDSDAEAERAEQTAANLEQSLSDAKKEADNLKSSFDDYNSVAEKLANCKKGTQEWTEALIENNEKVNELMDKYPELAKYVSMGSDG
jgi:DNA repair exonuclease SbcCD ATPase subunit